MGAKKKKGGFGNRLARMSDDERAKYFQRRADMEEEVRRRKEQLVANYMKNKLKREDAFTRINVAKINQYWHSIMRTNKCENMKKDVENLRKCIHRIVIAKNKTINKLMEELKWQEDLYEKNFETHSQHIDKMIETHNKNLDELEELYENDKKIIVHIGATEKQDVETRSDREIEYLKTMIYGQEIQFKNEEKSNHESNVKRIDQIVNTYKSELNQMQKNRDKISCSLWRQIAMILKDYTHQRDVTRFHLAELQRLDTENAIVRSKNEKQISMEKEQIVKLTQEYETLSETRQEQITNTNRMIKLRTKQLFGLRKDLIVETRHDEKQLTYLTNISNEVIEYLEKISSKGQQIMYMMHTCKKLEKEDLKTSKESSVSASLDLSKDDSFLSSVKTSDILERNNTTEQSLPTVKTVAINSRPCTSISKPKLKHLTKFKSEEIMLGYLDNIEKKSMLLNAKQTNLSPLSQAKIIVKNSKLFLPPLSPTRETSSSMKDSLIVDESPQTGVKYLEELDGLWQVYNNVKMDCLIMKQEKKRLQEQNYELKEIVKEVLSLAALGCASAGNPKTRLFSSSLSISTLSTV